METKRCPKCKLKKSFTKFDKDKSRKDGYHPYCKICKRKCYRADRDHLKNNSLKFNYSITLAEYEILFAEQQGRCAICSKIETANNQYGIKRLSVDHNHKSGKIRGLLCDNCNRGLGCFEENKSILLKVIQYLEKEINVSD